MPNATKPWYKSRTIWANVVVIVIAVLVQIQAIPGVPPEVAPWIVAAIAIGNVILRAITSGGITLTGPPAPPTP